MGSEMCIRDRISIFKDFKSLLQLIKLFSKQRPAIVHGNTPKAGLLTMIAAYICKVPYRIYYLHGLRYEGATGVKKKLLMNLERVSCRLATDVFSVSTGVKNTLTKDGICKKNSTVIWNGSINGIAVDHFNPEAVDATTQAKKYNIQPEDTVFGFVGRLSGDKGINELVAAFLKVYRTNPTAKLLLVGMFEQDLDPLTPETLQAIKEHNSIIHAGFQKDIRPFLVLMNIFTFASYREGFGIALMEAQAMNVPVISSDIIGCNEIIKEGYNGLLVTPKSVESLRNAMQKLANDKPLTQKMAAVSRDYMIKRYEQKRLWQETLTIYKQITSDV